MYVKETNDSDIDLSDRTKSFETLQQNTHIVSHSSNFRTVILLKRRAPFFGAGVDAFGTGHEFAKSKGMIHLHGLCWRSDREPYNLLF